MYISGNVGRKGKKKPRLVAIDSGRKAVQMRNESACGGRKKRIPSGR